ncbi:MULTISPECIES: GGDEF domain-containing protein [Deefgea]|uniref:diguanylate cyclase n=1 Tax=Deefgea chitinilytica TaxID=570276 RepID=A0ABS2CCD8_9NEIS|nr:MULTISPECIES: GGDEF domain-containing protein [Deefgea]MBM5571817.1 diguanylate cyclase [Deefgea chitinilytica]MBM9889052.1 GGDEF domain-containing protein [Deefgea sp. CFH1-16]
MLHWHALFWIAILIGIRGLIELLQIPGGHDFFGLLITCLLLCYAWFHLGFRTELRSFLLGISLYLTASVLDWLDGVFHPNSPEGRLVNMLDDLFFAGGIFFIGLAFIRVMLERDKLEHKLYRQAYLDELTELGNRRALFAQLEQALISTSGALLYIDVNLFKQVNDQFGHDRGDLVLCECAKLLKQSNAQAFRIGGDEFALLLSDENPQQICERLEQQVRPLTAEHGISFSIGVASFTANTYDNPDALLAAADQAMYSAKQAFRTQHRNATRGEPT